MCFFDGEKCDKGATFTVLCGTRRTGMVETVSRWRQGKEVRTCVDCEIVFSLRVCVKEQGLWREDCEFISYGMKIRIWVGSFGGVDMDEFLAQFMFLFHFDLWSLYLLLYCFFMFSELKKKILGFQKMKIPSVRYITFFGYILLFISIKFISNSECPLP